MQAGFPWSREVYAALVDKLMAAGARLIVFDVLFPSSKEGDEVFAETLKAYPGRVILASSFENPDSQDRGAKTPVLVLANDKLREAVNENWGVVNLPVWRDTKVRSVYTAVTASDIMGVPPLHQEEAVPSITAVASRSLGVQPPETLEENLSDFVIRFREQRV